MVPVSTANSLTTGDSQHLHSYGDDRDANSPVAEVVDVFRSTRQQYTPPAERSVEFADPDLTSDHEEFDSIFIAQPPPPQLVANSGGATQMDAFIAPESHLSSAGVSSIAGSSNVDLMSHHATTGGTASGCSPGDRNGYTSHDEAPWLVYQHADHVKFRLPNIANRSLQVITRPPPEDQSSLGILFVFLDLFERRRTKNMICCTEKVASVTVCHTTLTRCRRHSYSPLQWRPTPST